jgi:pyruvate,water dikinase
MAAEKLLDGRLESPTEFLALTTVANSGNPTARQLRDTQRLGEILRKDTHACLLLRQDSADLSDARQFAGTTFGRALRLFLKRYGSRAIHESDSAMPRLDEDPTPLLLTLRAELERPETERSDDAGRKAAQAAWRNVEASLPPLERLFPIRMWLLRALVGQLRTFYALRERVRFTDTLMTRARRRAELELGRRWEERGWLEAASDYHWLRLDDVERALAAPRLGSSGALRRRVESWKQRHAAWAGESMPNLLSEGETREQSADSEVFDSVETGGEVRGLPISPGKVRGVVTLLHEVSLGKLPPPDRILVAPVIGPSWAPLLARAKGVVVETGGMLSHGSILAREYGVPGVANIANAVSLFREGEEVVLDGTTGAVRRIAAPE